ncbi:FeoB-associated Cys-rich membrane protein [Labilibacter sediminis]|nr:FeoB-associated Cys-rich membrane protein [Labilibacter sediminis]
MGQVILMWICVISAFGYAFYSLGKIIWNTFHEKQSACSSSCGSCSAKTDLLKQINFKNVTKNQHSFRMVEHHR